MMIIIRQQTNGILAACLRAILSQMEIAACAERQYIIALKWSRLKLSVATSPRTIDLIERLLGTLRAHEKYTELTLVHRCIVRCWLSQSSIRRSSLSTTMDNTSMFECCQAWRVITLIRTATVDAIFSAWCMWDWMTTSRAKRNNTASVVRSFSESMDEYSYRIIHLLQALFHHDGGGCDGGDGKRLISYRRGIHLIERVIKMTFRVLLGDHHSDDSDDGATKDLSSVVEWVFETTDMLRNKDITTVGAEPPPYNRSLPILSIVQHMYDEIFPFMMEATTTNNTTSDIDVIRGNVALLLKTFCLVLFELWIPTTRHGDFVVTSGVVDTWLHICLSCRYLAMVVVKQCKDGVV